MIHADQTPPPEWTDTALGLPLTQYADGARACTTDEFIHRYGKGFLLHQGVLSRLGRQARSDVTLVSEERHIHRSVDLPFVVFPLGGPGSGGHVVHVGRARPNGVVLGDPSVSKLHAVIRMDDDGAVFLEDARSQNGSFVDDRAVPVVGRGEARRLESGALIRLGDVELTYLDAADFQRLVLAITRSRAGTLVPVP